MLSNRYLSILVEMFLLELEKLHCAQNKQLGQPSGKNTIREQAEKSGYEFSHELTPGRVNHSRFLSYITTGRDPSGHQKSLNKDN